MVENKAGLGRPILKPLRIALFPEPLIWWGEWGSTTLSFNLEEKPFQG